MASSSSTLSRVAWRNITSHKLRLVLTIISVVLGTAFITGAFVFTSSLDKAFKGAMSTAYDGVDVVVTCLLYTSPSPRDVEESRMPSSA